MNIVVKVYHFQTLRKCSSFWFFLKETKMNLKEFQGALFDLQFMIFLGVKKKTV